MQHMKAIDKLIRHYGGRDEVAEAFRMHKETLRLWERDGIPLGKALEVEEKSKGVVRAEQILREARQAA